MKKLILSVASMVMVLGLLGTDAAHAKAAGKGGRQPAQNRALVKADKEAVKLAKAQLSRDLKEFGPDSPQAQSDKMEVQSALEKLKADQASCKRAPAANETAARRVKRHARRVTHRGSHRNKVS